MVQLLNSRNTQNNLFVNYWMGGHQYQIEHHLNPQLPRYNLKHLNKLLISNDMLCTNCTSEPFQKYIVELFKHVTDQ